MYTEHDQNTDVQSLDNITQQNFLNVPNTWTEHRCSISWDYITTKHSDCTQNLNRTQMFSLLTLYHNKTFWLYTEHEQNTDVQSLDTISQQNILTVHRTWTEHRCSVSWHYITTKHLTVHRTWAEHRCSVSSLWLHQSSSYFLRMRGLSCHCVESSSVIMNPNKHSSHSEAHKNSASQEILCIYII